MLDFITNLPWGRADNVITVIIGVGVLAGAGWQWGGNFLSGIKSLFFPHPKSGLERPIPKRSVILVQAPHESWWHMGAKKNLPIMQIVTHWHVTNITTTQVRLISARLIKPKLKDHGIHTTVSVRHHNSDIYGNYPINPGATVPCSVDFYVGPPTRKSGETLLVAFELVDQYGNAHKVDDVELRYA